MRLIDADALHVKFWYGRFFGVAEIDIVNAPTIDVVPVRHAKDISDLMPPHCEFKCSLCGADAGEVAYGSLDGAKFNYCPNCGAILDEK